MNQVQRRHFLIAAAALFATPVTGMAQQQGKVWHVGYLSAIPQSMPAGARFLQGMREFGYVEGKNLLIDWRYAEGKFESLSAMAAELVGLKVEVILASGTLAVSAAQKATRTVPIVMGGVGDPVASGFVSSLSRPGGNITGMSLNTTDVSAKLLEMLLSTVPRLSRVAVLVNPDNASHATVLKNVEAAAQQLKLKIVPVQARAPNEIENAFAMMRREKAGAVYIAGDSLFVGRSPPIAELAIKHRMPSINNTREYAETGGLMSYGQNVPEQFRRAAAFVDKIFKGAKPGDLPIEQPTTFELVINRRTAKALGLAIPQPLLLLADRVIE